MIKDTYLVDSSKTGEEKIRLDECLVFDEAMPGDCGVVGLPGPTMAYLRKVGRSVF